METIPNPAAAGELGCVCVRGENTALQKFPFYEAAQSHEA